MALLLVLAGAAYAVIRIDITAPGRRLPIAVSDFSEEAGLPPGGEAGSPAGKELARIIRDDLEFTGLFQPLNSNAFVEPPTRPFNRGNWAMTGAEAVLKGSVVESAAAIKVSAYLYDMADGSVVSQKEYEASKELLRPLAHSIAGEVYGRLTGEKSVFRTKTAFVVSGKRGRELFIADGDGERPRSLGIRATSILPPHWSPDGERLIYSALKDGRWGIYLLNIREGKERLVHSSKGILIAGDFFPDGSGFAFSSSEQGSSAIYSYSFPGGGPASLSPSAGQVRKLSSSSDIVVSPSVSPDGKLIAFVSDRGGNPQVYIMDSNGYNTKRLTFEGSYNTSPSWSPAGDRLAFVGRHAGKNQVFTVNTDGSDLRRLTGEGNSEEPSYSPDGRFIAFASDRKLPERAGRKTVYIMRADGGGQRAITPPELSASGPRWSPN